MKILICGLPGTGKTTLSKILSREFGFNVKNDFLIFNELNIKIENEEDKRVISKKYSTLLFEYMKNEKDKYVFDFEYSILPNDLKQFNLDNFKVVYLGFCDLSNETLFGLFRNSQSNNEKTDENLKREISVYKNLSQICKEECEESGFQFFDVNKDRNIIFDEIIKFLGLEKEKI